VPAGAPTTTAGNGELLCSPSSGQEIFRAWFAMPARPHTQQRPRPVRRVKPRCRGVLVAPDSVRRFWMRDGFPFVLIHGRRWFVISVAAGRRHAPDVDKLQTRLGDHQARLGEFALNHLGTTPRQSRRVRHEREPVPQCCACASCSPSCPMSQPAPHALKIAGM